MPEQDAAGLVRLGLTPPHANDGNRTGSHISEPFAIRVDGYIRDRFLVYQCPRCGQRQEFQIPGIITSSVAWDLVCPECIRPLIVRVQGEVRE